MSHSSAGNNSEFTPRSSNAFVIEDASQVGETRRAVISLADLIGFGDVEQSNLAIVVTEMVNNIIRHAGRGELLLRVLNQNGVAGVELLALDKGPGMQSVAQCMEDGFSTGGTSGTGLGAISRLSSLDIYSRPGLGTALHSCSWAKHSTSLPKTRLGVVNRPKPGQHVCGDSWAMDGGTFLLVDGLGHGPEAAQAAQAAVDTFLQHPTRPPSMVLERIHSAMQETRGAAIAVAEVRRETGEIGFAGVGNIAGVILHDQSSRSMVSHYGIIGYQMRKVQEFIYPCPPESLLILSSDGIATGMSLLSYPGLASQHPSLIAGVLYRDFQRTNDDATILVARIPTDEIPSHPGNSLL